MCANVARPPDAWNCAVPIWVNEAANRQRDVRAAAVKGSLAELVQHQRPLVPLPSQPSDLPALWPFLLRGEQKPINESQIHMDNPRHRSREEIIIFEVMKVLPEARKLHWVSLFFLFFFFKACALILEKHEQTLAGSKANSTDLPFNGRAPCLLWFTGGHLQTGGEFPEMSQSGGEILKGPFSREGNCADLSVASSGLRLLSGVFLSSSEDVGSAVAQLKLLF